MKRFFTKKSVALILTTILLVGFFPLNISHALTLTELAGKVAGGVVDGVGTLLSGYVQSVAIPIASLFVALTGMALDFTVQYSIFGTGLARMADAVQSVWVLMRDTANILFIFILLYAAIQQIVSGTVAKKMLQAVIISAVLINFSLFITKVVIDASNLVAVSLFEQITLSTNTSGNLIQNLVATGNSTIVGTSEIDLSGRIMDSIGLTTLWDLPKDGASSQDFAQGIRGIGGLLTTVLTLITFLVTGFVFMMLAGLLIGRYVMLVILMATAPLGFVGEVIPFLDDTAKAWRKSLQDQALIAPAIMFFMFLVSRLGIALRTLQPGEVELGPTVKLFNFFLIVYLLLKSVKVTKGLSGQLGDFAGRIASMATGLGVAAVSGGTALVARQTLGRGANALAESQAGKRLEAFGARGGILGGAAKMAVGGIKGTAASTFDMRNTGTFKEVNTQAEEISGMKNIIGKDYLKASGEYGKGQTGYSGYVAKTTEDALKGAKDADKSAKDYEQQVVDRNPGMLKRYLDKKQQEIKDHEAKIKENEDKIAELNKQKTALENESKNATPGRKQEIKEKLSEIKDQKESAAEVKTTYTQLKTAAQEAKDKPNLGLVIKTHNSDFGLAESKVNNFQRLQKELSSKERELEDKFKSGATKEELGKIEGERDKLNSEISELDKDYKEATEVLKIGKISQGVIDTVAKLKDMRKTLASSYRNRVNINLGPVGTYSITNQLSKTENAEISSKIERDIKDKEPDIKDVLKKQSELEAKIDKQGK